MIRPGHRCQRHSSRFCTCRNRADWAMRAGQMLARESRSRGTPCRHDLVIVAVRERRGVLWPARVRNGVVAVPRVGRRRENAPAALRSAIGGKGRQATASSRAAPDQACYGSFRRTPRSSPFSFGRRVHGKRSATLTIHAPIWDILNPNPRSKSPVDLRLTSRYFSGRKIALGLHVQFTFVPRVFLCLLMK